MNAREIDAIYRTADEEFTRGEEAMLIAPLALMGLIEDLRRAERKVIEAGAYDVLNDG